LSCEARGLGFEAPERETMEDYVAVSNTKKDGLPDEKEIYHLNCFDEYFEEIKIERRDERGRH
jgi:hypothetical protein